MTPKERETYRKYHTPGMGNIYKRKVNAVFISAANSLEHEAKKLEVCYDILKNGGSFITEACRNKPDQNGKIRRIDVIDLGTGLEFEIETTPERAKRFNGEKGVIVIKTFKEEQNG